MVYSKYLKILVLTCIIFSKQSFAHSSLASTSYIWPTEGNLVSCFRDPWRPEHDGVDIAAAVGTPVRAALAGEVVAIDLSIGKITVKAKNEHTNIYLHNDQVFVQPGQSIEQGTLIAEMGNKGFSLGPHLHFSIYVNGRAMDPLRLLPSGGPDLTDLQKEMAARLPDFIPHERCIDQL